MAWRSPTIGRPGTQGPAGIRVRDPVKHLMPGPSRRRIAQDKVRSTVTLIGLVAFLPRTEANSPSARFASAEPLDLQQQEGKGVLSGQERFLRRSLSRSLRLPRRLSAFPGEQRHPPRTLTTYRPTAPTVRRPGALSGRATGGLCTPTRAGRDCDARPPAQRHQRAARSCSCCCAPVVRALSPGPGRGPRNTLTAVGYCPSGGFERRAPQRRPNSSSPSGQKSARPCLGRSRSTARGARNKQHHRRLNP